MCFWFFKLYYFWSIILVLRTFKIRSSQIKKQHREQVSQRDMTVKWKDLLKLRSNMFNILNNQKCTRRTIWSLSFFYLENFKVLLFVLQSLLWLWLKAMLQPTSMAIFFLASLTELLLLLLFDLSWLKFRHN